MTTGRVEQRSIPHVVSRRFEKRRTRNNACTVRRGCCQMFCIHIDQQLFLHRYIKRKKSTYSFLTSDHTYPGTAPPSSSVACSSILVICRLFVCSVMSTLRIHICLQYLFPTFWLFRWLAWVQISKVYCIHV